MKSSLFLPSFPIEVAVYLRSTVCYEAAGLDGSKSLSREDRSVGEFGFFFNLVSFKLPGLKPVVSRVAGRGPKMSRNVKNGPHGRPPVRTDALTVRIVWR